MGLSPPVCAPRHVQVTEAPGAGKAGCDDGVPDVQYALPPGQPVVPAGYVVFLVPQTPVIGTFTIETL